MTKFPTFRRPGTRYILTRLVEAQIATAPSIVECATFSDIYFALASWWPGVQLGAALETTHEDFYRGSELVATMREVFE